MSQDLRIPISQKVNDQLGRLCALKRNSRRQIVQGIVDEVTSGRAIVMPYSVTFECLRIISQVKDMYEPGSHEAAYFEEILSALMELSRMAALLRPDSGVIDLPTQLTLDLQAVAAQAPGKADKGLRIVRSDLNQLIQATT